MGIERVREWCDAHPATIRWIALALLLSLSILSVQAGLSAVEAFTR